MGQHVVWKTHKVCFNQFLSFWIVAIPGKTCNFSLSWNLDQCIVSVQFNQLTYITTWSARKTRTVGITDIIIMCIYLEIEFTPSDMLNFGLWWKALVRVKLGLLGNMWAYATRSGAILSNTKMQSFKRQNKFGFRAGAYLFCKWVPDFCKNQGDRPSKTWDFVLNYFEWRKNLSVLMKTCKF